MVSNANRPGQQTANYCFIFLISDWSTSKIHKQIAQNFSIRQHGRCAESRTKSDLLDVAILENEDLMFNQYHRP